MIRILTTFCLLILTAIPVQAQESPQALQDGFLAAVRTGDATAVGSFYAHDAVNYGVGVMAVYGPEGVTADWAPFLEANTVTEITLFDDHLETHGDTAIAWGLWRMTIKPRAGGEAATMEGRYMDVARKIDGRWLYVADHASVPLPPPPAD